MATIEYIGDDYGRGMEYLRQLREMDGAIKRKEMQRDELKSCLLPGCIRYDKDSVQSSPGNPMEEIMARVDLLDRDIEQLKADKALMVIRVADKIDSLTDATSEEKTILTGLYVSGRSVVEVADVVGYSIQHTYRLRKRGIICLGKSLKR